MPVLDTISEERPVLSTSTTLDQLIAQGTSHLANSQIGLSLGGALCLNAKPLRGTRLRTRHVCVCVCEALVRERKTEALPLGGTPLRTGYDPSRQYIE
jgi:hypothetical protein